MRLTVTSGGVKVSLSDGAYHDLEYTNSIEPGTAEPYTVEAHAETVDDLRALIACAEPEGSPTRLAVENVLERTSDLMDEWVAAVNAK